MISPEEIRDKCHKWWIEVLKAEINDEMFFPKEIPRIGKVKTKDILSNILWYKESIGKLRRQSKEEKGFGYQVLWEEKNFEKIGRNLIPAKVIIETLQDFLKITSKEKEFKYFVEQSKFIVARVPELKDWILMNPLKVVEHKHWADTLKVCHYFLETPKPNLYIRQLPIDVHTKFIKEENESLFRSLLEFLVPDYINTSESKFEKRYNLKYSEPLIRIRFLDKAFSPVPSISDISLTLSEFHDFTCSAKRVVVAENVMNFLTLPELPDTVALWSGGGFNVRYLKSVDWLKQKLFFYWGDIDAHGFQILNQFRTYFPRTIALMMDKETLEKFRWPDDKKGPKAVELELRSLSDEEKIFFQFLNSECIRLEQEKIPQIYAESKIREAVLLNP